jgi:hypothetical protein
MSRPAFVCFDRLGKCVSPDRHLGPSILNSMDRCRSSFAIAGSCGLAQDDMPNAALLLKR